MKEIKKKGRHKCKNIAHCTQKSITYCAFVFWLAFIKKGRNIPFVSLNSNFILDSLKSLKIL